MPEFFLELFSEEIPARMQARAADDLSRLIIEVLAPLQPSATRGYCGPRRLALVAQVEAGTPGARISERGPRISAPEQALSGFLRKHGAKREEMRQEGEYWVLEKNAPSIPAASLIADALPDLLRRFPWPKSMRWGGTSAFTWVRPLRRIICLLDGAVVKFDLRDGVDDGHGLAAGNVTEGHRFHAPGEILVRSFAEWREKLRAAHVLVDAEERRQAIAEGIRKLAATKGLVAVDDAGLLDEVAGLVEWPVPHLGKIDAGFMDLPPELMQVSMRVNQRYFALRHPDGSAAPWFGFVANVAAVDGGATIIAGNERVLRARFSDARHFWDLDRKARLEARVPLLDHVVFHAKLGSQGERVSRLERLSGHIAEQVGAGPALARAAARLCKADLVTGMVGEFPELQGAMGRYYALHDGEDSLVADAIRDHYAPKGPGDAVPAAPVSIAVALADKLDLLAGFFAIGEKPTGSGDPYALRRAGLGIIRIIRENGLRLNLLPLIEAAGQSHHHRGVHAAPAGEILDFLAERLRVALRAEGARHDVLAAVFAAGADDDIVRLLARTEAVATMLGTEIGSNLLTAYRRAANIVRIEERKDGRTYHQAADESLLDAAEEKILHRTLEATDRSIVAARSDDRFGDAVAELATLRGPVDVFFDKVTVNDRRPELRQNRLRLLSQLIDTMNGVADFSRIEG